MRIPRIKWNIDTADNILFVPAMLDMHYPLIKYAFYSKDYYPVVMSEEDGRQQAKLHALSWNVLRFA